MAQKTILVDDLDGTADDGVTTVPYTVGDTAYEIDVTTGHAEELKVLLEELRVLNERIADYTAASRTTATANGHRPARTPSYDPTAVRAWAQANGVAVSEKGRIAGDVVRQWQKATADTAA